MPAATVVAAPPNSVPERIDISISKDNGSVMPAATQAPDERDQCLPYYRDTDGRVHPLL